jgi:superfamily I DNA/RNA helicase
MRHKSNSRAWRISWPKAVLHAADEQDEPGGRVTLSTLHAAKGR